MYFVIMYTFAVHKREYSKVDSNLPSSFNTQHLIPKLATLYLMISRARVYCCVILIPYDGPMNEETSFLLRKLKEFAQIIEH